MIVLEELGQRIREEMAQAIGPTAPSLPDTAPAVPEGGGYSQLSDMSWQLRAVQLFSQTGNLAQVARELEMTIYELQKLTRTAWWMEELALLRREEMALTNVTLTRLLDKTLVALEDRLDNGDAVLTLTGKEMVPLDAKTLIRIADVVFDKRQLVRNLPTVIDGDSSKLASLAEKLARLGQARRDGFQDVIELMPSQGAERQDPSSLEIQNG